MELNPQFNYDKNGNLIGVFLTAEDWMTILPGIKMEISQAEKDFINERLAAYRANPDDVVDGEEFLKMLEEDEAT